MIQIWLLKKLAIRFLSSQLASVKEDDYDTVLKRLEVKRLELEIEVLKLKSDPPIQIINNITNNTSNTNNTTNMDFIHGFYYILI